MTGKAILSCTVVLLMLVSGQLSAVQAESEMQDQEAWLEADESDTAEVNDGQLEFLTVLPPGRPVHEHINRLSLLPGSLEDGWVRLAQCHRHLDPVPDAEIVFRPEHVRKLNLRSSRNIGSARVDQYTVQLNDIGRNAELCLDAELKLITRSGRHAFVLRSGPYMRRFLDGYYPMRVQLQLALNDVARLGEQIHPPTQTGFSVVEHADAIHIDTIFSGRLLIELPLEPR